ALVDTSRWHDLRRRPAGAGDHRMRGLNGKEHGDGQRDREQTNPHYILQPGAEDTTRHIPMRRPPPTSSPYVAVPGLARTARISNTKERGSPGRLWYGRISAGRGRGPGAAEPGGNKLSAAKLS